MDAIGVCWGASPEASFWKVCLPNNHTVGRSVELDMQWICLTGNTAAIAETTHYKHLFLDLVIKLIATGTE